MLEFAEDWLVVGIATKNILDAFYELLVFLPYFELLLSLSVLLRDFLLS